MHLPRHLHVSLRYTLYRKVYSLKQHLFGATIRLFLQWLGKLSLVQSILLKMVAIVLLVEIISDNFKAIKKHFLQQ